MSSPILQLERECEADDRREHKLMLLGGYYNASHLVSIYRTPQPMLLHRLLAQRVAMTGDELSSVCRNLEKGHLVC